MKIKQHIPNSTSGAEPKGAEFSSLEELLKIDFVERWGHDMIKGENDCDRFFRFSFSPYVAADLNAVDNYLLMAEFNEGKNSWVVGYLDSIEGLALPKWPGKPSN